MRKQLAIILIALFCLGGIPSAFAHAHLDHALPAVGSTVVTAPDQIKIWFTQKIEPAFSGAEVTDAQGARVDQDAAKVDADDASILHIPLKKLAPGTYKVVWHVTSVDTHGTAGDFTFTVSQ